MKRRRVAVSLLVLGVAALMISCGEPSPLGPASTSAAPQADLIGSVGGVLGKTGLLSCRPLPAAWARASIGPEGGVLHVGPHTFTVPAGALRRNVTITAYAPSDRYNRVEFEPEGLRFKKSASLRMSYANCNLLASVAPKHIAYVDDALNIQYLLQSVDDLLSRQVTGKVDHFSDYVIAW